ncbi:hypothetical protein EV363DRAFT_1459728 [Boletus edulis]|nr:hypothetical protein EV363DRAFT_1459728 [Boletus edulis]
MDMYHRLRESRSGNAPGSSIVNIQGVQSRFEFATSARWVGVVSRRPVMIVWWFGHLSASVSSRFDSQRAALVAASWPGLNGASGQGFRASGPAHNITNRAVVLSFHLPTTKCSQSGETTQCAQIDHPTDPVSFLDNHFLINNPGPDDHLFAWRHPKTGLRPLTRPELNKRMQEVITQYKLAEVKGHSFRIGGTLHYLLLGTPFDVVKTMGRWSGDSFTKYLRKHALILSPYLMERPDLVERLSQHAMPPVPYPLGSQLARPKGSSVSGRKARRAFAHSSPS